MLERHVRLRFETDTGAEDVGQGSALLGQGVDDGRAGWRQRRLEHVAQDAEDAVEVLEVGAVGLPLDARHHLGEDDEVDDEGGGEEGVLADVEETGFRSVSVIWFVVLRGNELTRWSGDRP